MNTQRDFIGKPKPPEPTAPKTEPTHAPMSPETPLQEILPENPDTLPLEELQKRFALLAIRCFNKENMLHLAKELIEVHEKTIKIQREDIRFLIDDSRLNEYHNHSEKVDDLEEKYFGVIT